MPCKRDLEFRLRRAGVSRSYARRVLRELVDHSEDLGRGSDRTGLARQLGDARRLADAFAEHYRNSQICGRHPFIAFLVSPAPVAALAVVAFLALTVPIPMTLEQTGRADPESVVSTVRALALIGVHGIPPCVAAAFGWLAVRSSHGVRAIWSSGLTLALFGAALQFRVDPPIPGQAAGEFALDLNLLPPNLPGLLLPLSCALAFTLLEARRRRVSDSILNA